MLKNRPFCRANNKATLTSLFGDVIVSRKGYCQRKMKMLFPLDGELNLAKDQFSDGVRLRLAEQISDRAYDQTVNHINLTTGAKIAKRQSINIVQDITQDLQRIQLMLAVAGAVFSSLPEITLTLATRRCPCCQQPMRFMGVSMRKSKLIRPTSLMITA